MPCGRCGAFLGVTLLPWNKQPTIQAHPLPNHCSWIDGFPRTFLGGALLQTPDYRYFAPRRDAVCVTLPFPCPWSVLFRVRVRVRVRCHSRPTPRTIGTCLAARARHWDTAGQTWQDKHGQDNRTEGQTFRRDRAARRRDGAVTEKLAQDCATASLLLGQKSAK